MSEYAVLLEHVLESLESDCYYAVLVVRTDLVESDLVCFMVGLQDRPVDLWLLGCLPPNSTSQMTLHLIK